MCLSAPRMIWDLEAHYFFARAATYVVDASLLSLWHCEDREYAVRGIEGCED